jgi:hypothetical protein
MTCCVAAISSPSSPPFAEKSAFHVVAPLFSPHPYLIFLNNLLIVHDVVGLGAIKLH